MYYYTLSICLPNFEMLLDLCFLQLSEEGPCEDLSGDGQLSSFNEWILPAKEFDGLWERFASNFWNSLINIIFN